MPQDSVRDVVLSFADFVATAALPKAAGTIVSTLLPKIADIVFPISSLESYVNSSTDGDPMPGVNQKIVLQDGTTLNINISQSSTPALHAKLVEIHKERTSPSGATKSVLSRTQAFFPYSSIPIMAAAQSVNKGEAMGPDLLGSGGVSILNGIIGISW